MFILEITNGVQQGQCLRLPHGCALVIGRAASADLTLDDAQASGEHVRFEWDEQGFSILDLKSRNGSYVNGVVVDARFFVSVGDFIQVGKTILQLKQAPPGASIREVAVSERVSTDKKPKIFSAQTMIAPSLADLMDGVREQSALVKVQSAKSWDSPAESSSPSAASPPFQTMGGKHTTMFEAASEHVVRADDFDAAAELLARLESDQDSAPKIVLAFCATKGSFGPRTDEFKGERIGLGRASEADVHLEDDSVSLAHVTVERRGQHFYLCDSQSSNGTYVNGQRVVERKIKDGDLIGIGVYLLVAVMSGNKLGLMVNTTTDVESETGRPKTTLSDDPDFAARMGVISQPSSGKKKKKKKKASDLVWFATSDLDRGVYRARSALLAMLVAMFGTGYLLATGDSAELAGGELISVHESQAFVSQAESMGQGGCTSCHVGLGHVSTLKCVGCHEENRPRMAHAVGNIQCAGCHQDHQGESFPSAANATNVCVECHASPHENLLKINPQLVEGFHLDASADATFHLSHHIDQTISCVSCHGEMVASGPRGARAACGQCHAPEAVSANQCQDCHPEHPDRPGGKIYVAKPAKPVPRFRYSALLWLLGFIVLPLGLAGLIPRQRKVELHDQETNSSDAGEEKKDAKKT